jgi:amino acid adenylation domain-containing protein
MAVIKNPLADFLLESDTGIVFIKSSSNEEYLSYKDIFRKASTLLFQLQSKGLRSGDELIISVDDNEYFITLFWACLLGKIIPVPLAASNQLEHRIKLYNTIKILENPAIALEERCVKQLEETVNGADPVIWSKIEERLIVVDTIRESSNVGIIKIADDRDLAYIQFSSGSTGSPKGVRLTYKNLLTNVKDIITRSKTSRNDSMLAWLPLTHDMGLICFHLCGVVAGVKQYIMPTTLFIKRPGLWLEKASEHKVTQLYSPNFGYHYLLSNYPVDHSFDQWDLSSVRLIYNGAEPISESLCRQFLSKMKNSNLDSNCLYPGYGLAEASVAVTLPEVHAPLRSCIVARDAMNIGQLIKPYENKDHNNGVTLVCVGKAIDQCEVRISDDEDNVLPEETLGNIQIKGNNVTEGYYRNVSETRKVFTKKGWLRTGDLGFIKDGELYVSGRKKNVIIVNGINYFPQDIEAAIIRNIPELSLGKVVVCSDQHQPVENVIAFVLFKGNLEDFSWISKEVKAIVQDCIGISVRHVLPVKKIPKTTSGKIQNFHLVDQYRNGEFSDILEFLNALEVDEPVDNNAPVEKQLLLILQQFVPAANRYSLSSFFDGSLSSLKAIHIVNRINQAFATDINVGYILQYPDTQKLSAVISRAMRVSVGKKPARAPKMDIYPSSFVQRKFWLVRQQAGKEISPTFLHEAFWVKGIVDVERLRQAVSKLIANHEVLRTSLFSQNGDLLQKVEVSVTDPIHFADLSETIGASHSVNGLLVSQLTHDSTSNKFFSITVLKFAPTEYAILLAIDHVIADGWSIGLLARQLKEYYSCSCPGNVSTMDGLQYKDFAYWQQTHVDSPSWHAQRSFWLSEFTEIARAKELPFSRTTISTSAAAGMISYEFSEEQIERLSAVAEKKECTLLMVVLSAVGLTLSKYLYAEEVVIGTTDSGRSNIGFESTMGCFINSIPVKVRTCASDSFYSLLARTKEKLIEINQHKNFPFEQLLHDLISSGKSCDPLFRVLVLLQNFDEDLSIRGVFEGQEIVPIDLGLTSILTDLEFEFIRHNSSLQLNLKYNKQKFNSEAVHSFLQYFCHLLCAATKRPDEQVCSIELPEPQKLLLNKFNQKVADYGSHSYVQRLKESVHQHASHIALVDEDHFVSYEELFEAAAKVSQFIIKASRPNPKVVILLAASENLVISLVSVVMAGGTYIPIDASNPTERIQFLFNAVSPDLVLTDIDLSDKIPEGYSYHCLPDILSSPECVGSNLTGNHDEEAPAYILFTSGSTGFPKGVEVSYGALTDYINTFASYFQLTKDDAVLQLSSISFDILVEEVFPVLLCGGKICISRSGARDIQSVIKRIVQEKITLVTTTPIVIGHLNRSGTALPSLRTIISGGEELHGHKIDQLILSTAVFNSYGPTETTVCATYHRVTSLENAGLIGKPIPNHEIHILDNDLNPVPIGAIGEICISGAGVAIGYLNDLALTEMYFVTGKNANGKRLYRTGDLGTWSSDGNIKFLGRRDSQVKFNGYRIEPGEIVREICHYPGVKDAFVQAHQSSDHNVIIAYVVSSVEVNVDNLLSHLRRRLPFYMVPALVVEVEFLPMTKNGKIDINRLPQPALQNADNEPSVPIDRIEEELLRIWIDVLKHPELTVLDNFFAVGGNSIYAVQITNRIASLLKIETSITQLFESPTVRKLRQSLDLHNEKHMPSFFAVEEQQYYSASPGQRRQWLLNHFQSNSAAHNLAWEFSFKKELLSSLTEAITFLLRKYEVLRTSITLINGEVKQLIHPVSVEPNIEYYENWDGTAEVVLTEARKPFSPESKYLYRVILFQKDINHLACILVMHHIIADGWSMEIILAELLEQMKSAEINKSAPVLPYQYKDFAAWSHTLLDANNEAGKKYWLRCLSGPLPVLRLDDPTRKPNGLISTTGATAYYDISDDFAHSVVRFSTSQQVTDFVVYLSLFNLLLHQQTRQNEFIIATPSSGRTLQPFEEQVGYFLNILPLRTTINTSESFASLIKNVNQGVLGAFANEYFPLEEIVEELGIPRTGGKLSMFDVIVVFQNFNRLPKVKSEIKSNHILQNIQEVDTGEVISNLLFEIARFAGRWRLKVRFNTDLFSPGFIDMLIQRFFSLGTRALGNVDVSLRELRMIDREELSMITNRFNKPYQLPVEFDVVKAFDHAVQRYPNRIAITCGDRSLTYKELRLRITSLMGVLQHNGYDGKGAVAGVLVGRSELVAISLLAVLKLRGVFLLLDTEHPVIRINSLLADTKPKLLIVDNGERLRNLSDDFELIVDLSLETSPEEVQCLNAKERPFPGDAPAYIMYTSGSSGKSKGVVVPFQGLNNYIDAFIEYFHIVDDDVVLQQSSFSFDILIEEILPILCCGGKLIIAESPGRDTNRLVQEIQLQKISLISVTPLIANELDGNASKLHSVRTLISGGDILRYDKISNLLATCEVHNTYGPTESTVCATYHRVSKGERDMNVIGRPVKNYRLQIIDEEENAVPPLVRGELWIEGPGVALGYLNQPEETHTKFSVAAGTERYRLYKTGDEAMWLSDGNILFLGRTDEQVKVNGYRVELQEITEVLNKYPFVKESLVLYEPISDTSKTLIAFVVFHEPVDAELFRSELYNHLPYYFVPSLILSLEEMPVNANGKIDRIQLRRLFENRSANSFSERLPQAGLEQRIAEVMRDILGLSSIGANENFFSVGLNSIKAIQATTRLKKEVQCMIDFGDIFRNPSVALLALHVANRGAVEYSDTVTVYEDQDYYPLSAAQKSLWLIDQLRGSVAYNITSVFAVQGAVSMQDLTKSMAVLVEKHPGLRASFIVVDDEPKQKISAADWIPVEIHEHVTDNRELSVQAIVQAEQNKPFDLSKGPLFRINVVCTDCLLHTLILTFHHIICDGWSIGNIYKEVNDSLNRIAEQRRVEAERRHYKDYIIYQNNLSVSASNHESYWLQTLRDFQTLVFPADFARPAIQSQKGKSLHFKLEGDELTQLYRIQRRENVSMNVLFLSALNILLFKYTRQSDITVGMPVSIRKAADWQDEVGFYINTLSIRNVFSAASSVRELVHLVNSNFLDAMEHAEYPFDLLVEKLKLTRDLKENPVFNIMVVMHGNYPGVNRRSHERQVALIPIATNKSSTKFDLTFNLFEDSNCFHLELEYNTDLFKESTVQRLLSSFVSILTQLSDGLINRISDVELLSRSEVQLGLICEYVSAPFESNVVDLIENTASQHPDAVAIINGDHFITYGQLIDRVKRLSLLLAKGYNIRQGEKIAVLQERSERPIIAFLAIMKIGASYVPLDSNYPVKRIEYIINDASIEIAITEEKFKPYFNNSVKVIIDDTIGSPLLPTPEIRTSISPIEIAYIIYTSGSTGEPKGVAITHNNLISFLFWCKHEFGEDQWRIMYAGTSFCFDLSVFEMFFSLLRGNTIRVLQTGVEIVKWTRLDKQIILNTVPSVIEMLLTENVDLRNVSAINMAGEPVPFYLKTSLRPRTNCIVRNLYGPTEDTTYSTCYRFEDIHSIIPIGKPIHNTQLLILDDDFKLVPDGMKGNIFLAGEGVALGYLNKPDLTNERFVTHPYDLSKRLYNTGDIGRRLPDGNVEYLGRIDNQIKLRGYRIELSEIESELEKFPGVSRVIASLVSSANGGVIVAYLTVAIGYDEEAFQRYARENLPSYLVPSNFIILDDFVLTSNGKVDRKQLPSALPTDNMITLSAWNDSDEFESISRDVWCSVLAKPLTSPDDNFFHVGGHSLKAYQIVSRTNRLFGSNVSLTDLFINPTFRSFISLVRDSTKLKTSGLNCVEEQHHYPVSSSQRRLWVIEKLGNTKGMYNMHGAYRIKGRIDGDVLKKVYGLLINRHEILRTSFHEISNEIRMKVDPYVDFRFSFILNYEEFTTREVMLENRLAQEAVYDFNLADPSLCRIGLFKLSSNEHVISVNLHHIVSDGWSRDILMNEVFELYNRQISQEGPLEPLLLQFKDYSCSETKVLTNERLVQQQKFWQSLFKPELKPLKLGARTKRKPVKTYNGSSLTLTWGKQLSIDVMRCCVGQQVTLFMYIQSALIALLYKYTAEEDFIIGTPVTARKFEALENQVGFYTNTLALRNKVAGYMTFKELLSEVRKSTLEAFNNVDYPFDQLVETLQLPRDPSRSPLFDIMLVTEEKQLLLPSIPHLGIERVELPVTRSKFDLIIHVSWKEEELVAELTYNTDLFEPAFVERFSQHLRELVRSTTITNDPLTAIQYLTSGEKVHLMASRSLLPNTEGTITVLDLLYKAVEKYSHAAAVKFGDQVITYEELDKQSNQLAYYLRKTYSLKEGDIIGIKMFRSIELIVSIWAILKTGAMYAPLDPQTPEKRINLILNNCNPKVVVTDTKNYFTHIDIATACICDLNYMDLPYTRPHASINGSSGMYVIHTSGTTGIPKGVVVEHASVINLISWISSISFANHPEMMVLLNAPVSFDSSVKLFFSTFLNGATLIIPSEETRQVPSALVNYMLNHRIDMFDATPSFLNYLLDVPDFSRVNAKYCFVGGEIVSTKLVNRFFEVTGKKTSFVNVYGVTEATVDSTYCIARENHVSIGTPIDNTAVLIIDGDGNPVPEGIAGEIAIAGVGLARGYLNDQLQTHTRFVNSPALDGTRLYLTGDLGYFYNGETYILRRNDNQVKIRGYRIELNEIRTFLEQVEGIQEAIVDVLPDSQGEPQIIAYCNSKSQLSFATVRQILQQHLPEYMIPFWILFLDEFPVNSNGKLDKQALPRPSVTAVTKIGEHTDDVMGKVIRAFQTVLSRTDIKASDNFFENGGNSLKVLQLFRELNTAYPNVLQVYELFSNPTVNMVSNIVKSRISTSAVKLDTKQDAVNFIEL